MSDWLNPTVDELRKDYARPQECHCPGACIVNGVRGPCPMPGKPPTFLGYLEDHAKMSDAFGNIRRAEAIRRIASEIDKEVP